VLRRDLEEAAFLAEVVGIPLEDLVPEESTEPSGPAAWSRAPRGMECGGASTVLLNVTNT
jgi:hypothetical protein